MDRYTALRERLGRGETIVLDGGIGAELVRRGVRWRDHAMRTDSQVVQAVHEEFLAAGADIIRTNTFQLSQRTYLNVFRDPEHMRHIGAPGLEHRAARLMEKAVDLANAARKRSGCTSVPIAGVMSPLEHCFRPDLAGMSEEARTEHGEIAGLLAKSGVDFLLLESMSTIGEASVAAAGARATGLPTWASFVVDAGGSLLSGEPLAEAAQSMLEFGVEAILVNCAPPEDVSLALQTLAKRSTCPFGAYAHVGKFDPPSWKFEFYPQFSQTEGWSPDRYAAAARAWRASGARLIGGCCGTGPAHTLALKAALTERR